MYPPKFDYYRASSLDEAFSLMSEHSGAKWLAGGHSLVPAMKLRLSDPGTLIDIGRIDELRGISRSNGQNGNTVRIGALTTHAMVEHSTELPHALPEAAGWIADQMVRNRGTVGGNIAHADPASDLPTVLVALDATLHLRSPDGERTVKVDDFFLDLFMTDLRDGEILTAVDVPMDGAGSAYAKLFNPASRYAIVGVAAKVKMKNGQCTDARVAIGGMTPTARRAPSVEQALVGQALDVSTIDSAAGRIVDDLGDEVMGDMHASAEYRRSVAPAYVAEAVRKAMERAN